MTKPNMDELRELVLNLPAGYVKVVPYDIKRDVTFEFNGVVVKMSALYLSGELNCYMFDLYWGNNEVIYGIPIRSGLDILKQYKTPLPNMYAYNTYYPNMDVTSWRQLQLFVIDKSVLDVKS